MTGLARSGPGLPAAPDPTVKARAAARQFEAILLNTVFGSLEHSFSELPGASSDPVSDNYHALSMQALSASVAAERGLGIADRIVPSLLKTVTKS